MILKRNNGTYSVTVNIKGCLKKITLGGLKTEKEAKRYDALLKKEGLTNSEVLKKLIEQKPLKYIVKRKDVTSGKESYRVVKRSERIDKSFTNLEKAIEYRDLYIENPYKQLHDQIMGICSGQTLSRGHYHQKS